MAAADTCPTCTTTADRLSWERGALRSALPDDRDVRDWCERHQDRIMRVTRAPRRVFLHHPWVAAHRDPAHSLTVVSTRWLSHADAIRFATRRAAELTAACAARRADALAATARVTAARTATRTAAARTTTDQKDHRR